MQQMVCHDDAAYAAVSFCQSQQPIGLVVIPKKPSNLKAYQISA
jgi:hypothetical protein